LTPGGSARTSPPREIKIDRSFVDTLGKNPQTSCDQVQGFYYGKPEPDVAETEEQSPLNRPLVA
jgi:EAL domain-containing protein (putative c-di-GMP-specific phosphodiesterase class I)